MIVVIADDFTGAAELAGIGLRYGLSVALLTKTDAETNPDLLIVCTDSRSLPKKQAIQVTADAIKWVLSLKPQLLYKKMDSVLRGHVLAELEIQMELSGLHTALVIPANPSLGRTIRDGHYFIHDRPAHEAGFASDPEFAIFDSSIVAMVDREDEVQVLLVDSALPGEGIIIGEAASSTDISKWVEKIEPGMALAGAGDFFTALLERHYKEQHVTAFPFLGR